jgi:hypothetical protein
MRIFPLLLSLLLLAPAAFAQVRIDADHIILNSGKTLQEAIDDGDLAGGGGAAGSTTSLDFTVNSDAVGTEPAQDSGYCVGGGSGPLCWLWNTTTNMFALTGPTGTRVSFPDPGDGIRGSSYLDNGSTCEDPSAGQTTVCTINGKLFLRDTGGSLTPLVQILARTATPVTVTLTTAYTTLYSYSIPDSTLGLNRAVCMKITGTHLNNTAPGTGSWRFRVSFGGVVAWGDSHVQSANANIVTPWFFDLCVRNTSTESLQVVSGTVAVNLCTVAASPTGDGIISIGSNQQTGTIRGVGAIATNSGGADAFLLEIQLPYNDSGTNMIMETAEVELR